MADKNKPAALITIPRDKLIAITAQRGAYRIQAKKSLFDSLTPEIKVKTVFTLCKFASGAIQKVVDTCVPPVQQQDIKSKMYAMKSAPDKYIPFLNGLRYDSPLIGGDSGFDPVMQPWVTFGIGGGACGDFSLLASYFMPGGKLAFVADVKNMSGWHVYYIAHDGSVWSHLRSATGVVKKLQGADERTIAKYFNSDWTHCGTASPDFSLTSLTTK